MSKVRLTLGRQSITASGDTLPQARGRALAAWREKYGANAKGATFATIDALDNPAAPQPAEKQAPKAKAKPASKAKPAAKPEAKAAPKAKAAKPAAKPAKAPEPDAPKPKRAPRAAEPAKVAKEPPEGAKIPLGGLEYGDFLVLGVSMVGRIEEAISTSSLEGARSLAGSRDAIRGRFAVVAAVTEVIELTGRMIPGSAALRVEGLAYLERVVIGVDGADRVIAVQVVRGVLAQARAVARAMAARRVLVVTVRNTFER